MRSERTEITFKEIKSHISGGIYENSSPLTADKLLKFLKL